MAKQAHANSRRLYWWDSHISSKNTRWLKENLTDMDAKVKSMIKLIEEDADSFARRAEMYYKKRPELVKMVEDFYRAYRALAERYDHATGALRQAHKTITEAFPNQVPDDELAPDDEYTDDKKGLKQFTDSLGGVKVNRGLIFDEDRGKEDQSTQSTLKLEKEIKRLKEALAKFEAEKESSVERLSHQELEVSNIQDSEKKNAEVEVESLKIALKKLENEKESSVVEYQKCIERIKDMDSTISSAQKSILDLNERAQKAEAEAQSLKLNLATLKSENATSIDQCKQSLEKIAALENKLVFAEEEAKKLEDKAREAETEAKILKKALDELGVEKEANAVQNQQFLDTISTLEIKISFAEDEGKKLKERAKEAEMKAETLKKALDELGVEKEANAVQNQQLLDTISTLEKEIFCSEEEVRMLNGEIENGVAKLMGAQEKCVLLEKSNQSLNFELESLNLKITEQCEELAQKKSEIGLLWTRFLEAETAFQILQLLHAQTGEEMKSLALELQSKSLIISDLENRNQSLLNESLKFKEEIKSLNELNLASSVSITNMQNEIIILSEIKLKLEEEVELRVDERNALQQDIYCLKEELNDLNKKYLAMSDKVKDMQNENSNLKVIQERELRGKEDLLEKLENLEKVVEEKALLEKSLFDLSTDLKGVREEKLALEKCLKSASEEKITLLLEKDAILTQLQVATENLEKISEKNTFMENSISDAQDEIEGLNIRLKSFEESCQILENEKFDLTNENITLVSQLEISKERLEDFENKYRAIEENYAVLEKQKESTLCEVDELRSTVNESKFKEEKQKIELENLQGKVEELNIRLKSFEESCQILENEKSDLSNEKVTLVSQVAGLSVKLKSLEESCQILEDEKYDLTNQKVALVSEVETNRERVEDFEKKYRVLEENYAVLEKKKESALCKIDELQSTLQESHFKEEKQMNELENLQGKVEELNIRLKSFEESCQVLENVKSDLTNEKFTLVSQVEGLSIRLKSLEESYQILEDEKSDLTNEKVSLVSQIEGLSMRLKSSEQSCQVLEDEKSDLINEKVALVSEVKITTERLEDFEKKYRALEENYAVLEKQKEFALCEIDELQSISKESKFKEEKQMTEISNLHGKVEELIVRLKVFEESCQILETEKFHLSNEKVTLVSEVEGLSIRLKCLEESCQVLEDEKSDLTNEKVALVSQVEITREILVDFEKKYRALEENYAVLEKQKESALCEVDELRSIVNEGKVKEEKQMIEIENLRGNVLDLQNSGVLLEEENLKLDHEKMSIVKDFLDLQEKNNSLEAENHFILDEAAFFSNLSLIFTNIINEKSLEIEDLRSTVDKLQVLVVEFEEKISVLQVKLEEARLENMDLANTSATLEEESLKLALEKTSLVKDFLDLQEKSNSLEAENLLILGETAFSSNLSLIFENIINEKSLKIEELRLTVDKLDVLSVEFEGKVSVLHRELAEAQLENMDLKNTRANLEEENLKLVREKLSLVKDFLDLQEMNNSLEAENLVILGETAFFSNLSLIFKNIINEKSLEIEDLQSTVDKLQVLGVEFEDEISVLQCKLEERQLENLDMKKLLMKTENSFSAITLANLQLNLEIENGKDLLCQMETEISKSKCKVYDNENEKLKLQNKIVDLKEKSDEITMLWENEATNLTNELHNLFVLRALLEEKFQELSGVLKYLERETDSKDKGIELLEERISTLEGENREIVAQLADYVPAISSIMDSISSLENTTCLHIQLQDGNHENLKGATENHVASNEDSNAYQSNMSTLSELCDLKRRIKAVERMILEINSSRLETVTREIKELGSEGASNQEKGVDVDSGEIVEKELGINKLAIPKRFSIPNQELDKTKILERLNSDSEKLSSLQTTVHDLKRKMEIIDKKIKIRSFGENESLEDELAKAEEDIMQLSDLNGKLMKNVDNFDDVKEEENRNLRKKFSEQARKVSERIGQLQLEVQKIQFAVLKLVRNGKNKTGLKSKRASLRNYLGLRSSNKKNKRTFCGCVRPHSTDTT